MLLFFFGLTFSSSLLLRFVSIFLCESSNVFIFIFAITNDTFIRKERWWCCFVFVYLWLSKFEYFFFTLWFFIFFFNLFFIFFYLLILIVFGVVQAPMSVLLFSLNTNFITINDGKTHIYFCLFLHTFLFGDVLRLILICIIKNMAYLKNEKEKK